MSTDEKYLSLLSDIPKDKVIAFRLFSDIFKKANIVTSPEGIFLLLYKKGWVTPFMSRFSQDFNNMQLGFKPKLENISWNLSIVGRKHLESLTSKELLKKEYQQTKLDI